MDPNQPSDNDLTTQPPSQATEFQLERLPVELQLMVVDEVMGMRWAEAFAMSLTSTKFHSLVDMSKVRTGNGRPHFTRPYDEVDLHLIASWPIYGGPKDVFSEQNLPVTGRDSFACSHACNKIKDVANFRTADIFANATTGLNMQCLDCILSDISDYQPDGYWRFFGLDPSEFGSDSSGDADEYLCMDYPTGDVSNVIGAYWPFGGRIVCPWYDVACKPSKDSGGVGLVCVDCHKFKRVPDWVLPLLAMTGEAIGGCVECRGQWYFEREEAYIQHLRCSLDKRNLDRKRRKEAAYEMSLFWITSKSPQNSEFEEGEPRSVEEMEEEDEADVKESERPVEEASNESGEDENLGESGGDDDFGEPDGDDDFGEPDGDDSPR